MPQRIDSLPSRMLSALTEWLLLFPVWFPLCILIFPDAQLPAAALALTAALIAGILLHQLLAIPKLWQCLAASLAGALLAGWVWPGSVWAKLALGAMIGIVLFRGQQYGLRRWDDLLNPNVVWASMLLFFAGYFFFRHAEVLQPHRNVFGITGMIALGIALFLSNTMQIHSAALTRGQEDARVVRPILRTNRKYLAVLYGLIIAISFGEAVWHAVTSALKKWLSSLSFPDTGEDAAPAESPPLTAPGGDFPLEPGEPSRLAVLLQTILQWVIYILLIAAALIGLYYAFKGLRKLLGRLFRLLGRNVERSDDTGYIDEKESLLARAIRENRQRWGTMFSRLVHREPKWDELADNRERARFLFKHWLKRLRTEGYEWHPQHAPAEIFRDAARWRKEPEQTRETSLAAYHKARYGPPDVEPSAWEIERMREELKG